ncbi:MAG: hypothetical protein HYY84_07655 [Deltaproteobacteria bacterium]|nr:hypothetical protein [Deltaproteobacteria bacterium]
MKWTSCGCAGETTTSALAPTDACGIRRSFWKRTWKWWTAALLALLLGASVAYYVLFVPSAEYVAQKRELEAKQQSLDQAFGPAPKFEDGESAEMKKETK